MTDATAPDTSLSLRHFPIAFFAVVMGMWGWVLASQAAVGAGVLPSAFSVNLRWLAVLITVLIFVTYGIKAVLYPSACKAEWRTPPKLAFFPAASISLLLVGTAFLDDAPAFAETIWLIGAIAQGVLALAVVSSWINHRSLEVGQLSPAWFIPAVGNVVAPLAGAQLGYIELSWLFLSGGLIFWLVLLTLVINRLMFHDPLPGKLLPTLVILIAPPAVAFSAYVGLTGQVDGFARILINAAFVFGLLVLIQLPKFRTLPFALSWWALSFPVAALVGATFTFGRLVDLPVYTNIAALILGALTLVMVALVLKTLWVLAKGHFFRPEG